MKNFTPGSWLIDCTDEAINEYKNGMVIKSSDNKNIIAVVTHELENWKEQEENVKLIAAAPDMHAILTVYIDTAQVIFYEHDRDVYSHEDWENVCRASKLLGDRKEFVNDLENYLNE
jgi:hypothetical protein